MVNVLVGGVFSVIVLAFLLNFTGHLTNAFGTDVFSNIIRNGIQGLRGG